MFLLMYCFRVVVIIVVVVTVVVVGFVYAAFHRVWAPGYGAKR